MLLVYSFTIRSGCTCNYKVVSRLNYLFHICILYSLLCRNIHCMLWRLLEPLSKLAPMHLSLDPSTKQNLVEMEPLAAPECWLSIFRLIGILHVEYAEEEHPVWVVSCPCFCSCDKTVLLLPHLQRSGGWFCRREGLSTFQCSESV